jgi:hypothetical protein
VRHTSPLILLAASDGYRAIKDKQNFDKQREHEQFNEHDGRHLMQPGPHTAQSHESAIEFMQGRDPSVSFGLMVKPVGKGKYQRVGLAMLYLHALEALGATMQQFEIV